MATWLIIDNPTSGHHSPGRSGKFRRANLDLGPCPTVSSDGVYGDKIAAHYLADDGMTTPKSADKPMYRVPSMAEIAETPLNGYKMVSTFSGCGGACLGYKMAGFEVAWANEFIPAARETYLANFPDVHVDDRDIRDITAEEILRHTGLEVGALDVLEGSPPCAAFSTAGKRDKKWNKESKYSDSTQRSDDLFFEFARLLQGLQPRAFSAENVSGLLKGRARGYFKLIMKALQDCGYRVEARLLDAQWLGVPQARQRVFFVGVRNDLGVDPVFPAPLPYRYSVRDALPHISRHGTAMNYNVWEHKDKDLSATMVESDAHPAPTILQAGPNIGAGWVETGSVHLDDGRPHRRPRDITDEPHPTVAGDPKTAGHVKVQDVAPTAEEAAEVSIEGRAIGDEWENVPEGGSSERYFQLTKPDRERPSPTVTAAGGQLGLASVVHPTERRKFTLAELRRISAFPDDFVLTGSYSQGWERIGRAVPPLMARAVAEGVREALDKAAK